MKVSKYERLKLVNQRRKQKERQEEERLRRRVAELESAIRMHRSRVVMEDGTPSDKCSDYDQDLWAKLPGANASGP